MIERQTLQTPRGTFFFQSTFTNECLKDIKKNEKNLNTRIKICILQLIYRLHVVSTYIAWSSQKSNKIQESTHAIGAKKDQDASGVQKAEKVPKAVKV